MKPGELKTHYVVRGDTYSEILKAENEDGTPFDLTLYSGIFMDIRTGKTEETQLVLRFALGDGISIAGSNDLIVFEKDYAETKPIPGQILYRDIRFMQNGTVLTQAAGIVQVINNISEIPTS
jgi:hypothetical protein